MTLDELRAQIDAIDAQLVSLLEQRANLALEVKKVKTKSDIDTYSAARERQIIEKVLARAKTGNFPQAALERVFGVILSATRSLVGELSVAYVGPELSPGHQAAHQQFGANVRFHPASSVEEIFRKVELGEIQYGVVPVESSFSDAVAKTFETFLESPLRVIAELLVDEKLFLYSSAETLSNVRRLVSDAASLARAAHWLRANLSGAELIVAESGAVAGELAVKDATVAVLGPALIGERFSLRELASGIEENHGDRSRYFVVSQKPAEQTKRDKTSILCVVKDRAGALKDLLTPFAEHGLTLTKIESKSMRRSAWEYAFVIDFLGHVSDPPVQEAVKKIEAQCSLFKLLGSYPHA